IDQGQNHRSAKETIFRLGIQIADFTLPLADRASALRSSTKHRSLSLGDRACIARALHAQGAKVAVSGTRREVLDQLASELGGAAVLPCDLADKDSVEALVPD